MANWIARIKWAGADAVLTSDGTWQCDNEDIADYLNTRFDPRRAKGLGTVLPFGTHAAMLAAAALKGEATLATPLQPAEDFVS